MFRSLVVGTALAVISSVAFAADIPVFVPPPPPPAPPPPVVYDWTGFYVGGFGGLVWGGFEADSAGVAGIHALNDFGQPLDEAEGWLAGGTLGFNWMTGNFVFDIEADGAWSSVDADFVTADPEWHAELNWLVTVRPRVGIAFGRVLPYITGGLAIGEISLSSFDNVAPPGGGSDENVHFGWTGGGGIEFGLTQNISVKGEYNYVDLGEERYVLSGPASFFDDEDLSFTAHIFKFGANLRF